MHPSAGFRRPPSGHGATATARHRPTRRRVPALRRRWLAIGLLTSIVGGLAGAVWPPPIEAANPLDVVMLRAGRGIVAVLTRACEILTQIGGQAVQAQVASSAFAQGNRKLRVSITGAVAIPGRHLRGRLITSLNQDCPLPNRRECQGIFRLNLPADVTQPSPNEFYWVPFRLDLAIDVEQTLKIITMMGIGFGLDRLDLFPDEAFLGVIAQLPCESLHGVLARFFPALIGYLEKRTISRGIDEILADGRLHGGHALQALGLDELIGFGINFGIGMAQTAATGFVKEAVAAGAGAAVLALPGMAPVAVGALLQVLAVKATGLLIDLGKEQFNAGIYRDRFAKIDAFLQGTWSPGQHHLPWLENTIAAEAKQDRYYTIQKLIIYLRAKDPTKRGWWSSLHGRLRAPLVFRAEQDQSSLAGRYLGMLDLLLAP